MEEGGEEFLQIEKGIGYDWGEGINAEPTNGIFHKAGYIRTGVFFYCTGTVISLTVI